MNGAGAQELAEWLRYLRDLGVADLAVPRVAVAVARPPAAGRSEPVGPRPAAKPAALPKTVAPVDAPPVVGLPMLPAFDGFDEPGPADPGARLAAIREGLGECTRCKLHERRTQIVFGVGNPRARLLFVGEGPGAEEDARGEPFVGRAGKKLDEMISAIGLRREDVYIANVVKCRPPDNREPLPDETATCSPFLFQQIAAIRPRVIVTLGAPAARTLLNTKVGITRLRGQWQSYRGIPVMPTFHPAFLLRAYTIENRRMVFEDLKAARTRLDEAP